VQRLLLVFFIVLSAAMAANKAMAQAVPDTTTNNVYRDTVTNRNLSAIRDSNTALPSPNAAVLPNQPNPKKAGLYSAILPGMGQAYNGQYWKIPVIYAGVAVSGAFLIGNTSKYHTYRRAYINALQGKPTGYEQFGYGVNELKILQDGYKHYLDLTTLFMGLGYAIQVVDAITFAHLKNFDVSRDISLNLQPVVMPGYVGLGLVMQWNNSPRKSITERN